MVFLIYGLKRGRISISAPFYFTSTTVKKMEWSSGVIKTEVSKHPPADVLSKPKTKNKMKKLSVFIALCIILSSCTKTVENIPVPGNQYKVPIQIDLRSEGMAVYFDLKKGANITSGGEFYFGDGYIQNGEAFLIGEDVDLTLVQWDGTDPNEERTALGSAVIHIKFSKGTEVDKDITGTGTWTSDQGEGTMTNYTSEGAVS